jgi:hypothetical protein
LFFRQAKKQSQIEFNVIARQPIRWVVEQLLRHLHQHQHLGAGKGREAEAVSAISHPTHPTAGRAMDGDVHHIVGSCEDRLQVNGNRMKTQRTF